MGGLKKVVLRASNNMILGTISFSLQILQNAISSLMM